MNPYDRERKLMPIMVEATQRGVLCDRVKLGSEIEKYEDALDAVQTSIRKRLGAPGLSISSATELATALDAASAVTEQRFTPTGRRSTKRSVLEETIIDAELKHELIYWGVISKSLSDFLRKWWIFSADDGRLHPNWNQVRNTERGQRGARTGRLSSDSPNFQNVTTEYEQVVPVGYPSYPVLRCLILPDEGKVWLKRDFSGQEIRVCAHFEDGVLLAAYIADPGLDPHEMARQIISAIANLEFERKHVKITAFQIIYGGGPSAIAVQVGCDYGRAGKLRDAYLTAMPGIKSLQQSTKRMGYAGQPITTWGGRDYDVEPPKVIKGRRRTFEYKLLNYLIQGSAADQTKQCICDWYDVKPETSQFLATVHDEINIQADEEYWQQDMEVLRSTMEQDLFDCPMRTEGFMGYNWHELEKVA